MFNVGLKRMTLRSGVTGSTNWASEESPVVPILRVPIGLHLANYAFSDWLNYLLKYAIENTFEFSFQHTFSGNILLNLPNNLAARIADVFIRYHHSSSVVGTPKHVSSKLGQIFFLEFTLAPRIHCGWLLSYTGSNTTPEKYQDGKIMNLTKGLH